MTSTQSSKPTGPKPTGWFNGRTRLITVASIVAVGLAGATAVSANTGLLDTASGTAGNNELVSADQITPSTQVIDVYLPDTTAGAPLTTTLPAADSAVQQFTVDVAGTVAVAATDAGLRLDQVAPAAGWSWSLTQNDPSELLVAMTNGARTFEFTATMTADGNIAASVTEPIVTPAPQVASSSSSSSYSGDDDYDDDDHDDDEYEDDDHDEYEGGEDDD